MVLDGVSSPITKRVYNMALEEFLAWFREAPRQGFTKATVSAWRASLEVPRLVVHHRENVRDSKVSSRGGRQRGLGAGVGGWNCAGEGAQILSSLGLNTRVCRPLEMFSTVRFSKESSKPGKLNYTVSNVRLYCKPQ